MFVVQTPHSLALLATDLEENNNNNKMIKEILKKNGNFFFGEKLFFFEKVSTNGVRS